MIWARSIFLVSSLVLHCIFQSRSLSYTNPLTNTGGEGNLLFVSIVCGFLVSGHSVNCILFAYLFSSTN